MRLTLAVKIAALALSLASTTYSDELVEEEKTPKEKVKEEKHAFIDSLAPAGRVETNACTKQLAVAHCCTSEAVGSCISTVKEILMDEDNPEVVEEWKNSDKSKTSKCTYIKSAILCYPECVQNSKTASIKSKIGALEKNHTDDLKCGGSGLAPGAGISLVIILAKLLLEE